MCCRTPRSSRGRMQPGRPCFRGTAAASSRAFSRPCRRAPSPEIRLASASPSAGTACTRRWKSCAWGLVPERARSLPERTGRAARRSARRPLRVNPEVFLTWLTPPIGSYAKYYRRQGFRLSVAEARFFRKESWIPPRGLTTTSITRSGRAARSVVVPIVMVAPIVMVIVVPAMVGARMRYRGRRKPFTARAIRKRQRRSRAALADAGLVPVAHAVRENGVQPVQLRGREDQRRIVGGVERLQLALQDVLNQRAPGDLARRRVFLKPRVGIAPRHVGDRSGEGRVASQEAEIGRAHWFRGDHLRLPAHGVERLLGGADVQVRQPRVHGQERLQRDRGDLRRRGGQEPRPIAPHQLIAVIAVVGRVNAGTLREAAPDVVDAERPDWRGGLARAPRNQDPPPCGGLA